MRDHLPQDSFERARHLLIAFVRGFDLAIEFGPRRLGQLGEFR